MLPAEPTLSLWDTLISVLLGFMQGITEFLPISSSAHLILAREVLGWNFGTAAADLLFDVVLHVGTMLAVLVYFRNDLFLIFSSLFTTRADRAVERRLGWCILLGTVPAALAGVLFQEEIENFFRQRVDVIVALLAGVGVLMWIVDLLGRKQRGIENVHWFDGLLVGVAQATALMPGVSRSGATITMALLLGMKRADAARFSFLLSTPAIVGAAVWTLKDVAEMRMPPGAIPYLIVPGFVASLVAGVASIGFLLRFLRRRSVLVFTLYRVVIAAVLFFALVK